MERGGDGRSTRHLADLPGPERIGAEAGRRAVPRLGARKIDSQHRPGDLREPPGRLACCRPLIGAISGPSVARGVSFLKDKLGQRLFAPGHRRSSTIRCGLRGLGSAPFDDEGVATSRQAIIDDGVLTTWLLNTASARQLGLADHRPRLARPGRRRPACRRTT